MKVEYRNIVGFPGYRIGNDGTVWTCWGSKGGSSLGGIGQGGMKIGNRWKQRNPRRAGGNNAWRVNLRRDGRTYHFFVHVLVLEAFVSPRPIGMVSRHGPLGKDCNHVSNLSWGTQKQNIADKERDGTRVFGTRHHAAKMTPELVKAIREEYDLRKSLSSLAKKYRIARSTLRAILNRETWKEVA